MTAQSAGIQDRMEQTESTYCLLSYTCWMLRLQEDGVLTVKHQSDVAGGGGWLLVSGLGVWVVLPAVLFSDIHLGIKVLVLLAPWSPPPPLPFADPWGIKSPCPSALKLDSSSPTQEASRASEASFGCESGASHQAGIWGS